MGKVETSADGRRRKWGWWVGALLAVAVVGHIVSGSPGAQREREAIDLEARRVAAARPVVQRLRQGLRDPASLQLESVRVSDREAVVCVAYRARNGFGGMNREAVVAASGVLSPDPRLWNKYCVERLPDVTQAF